MAELLLWITALALLAIGLAGCIYPMLPGLPLMLAGVWLAAWIDDYARIGGMTIGIVAALTVIGLLLDFVAGMLGAQRARASRDAIVGATLGSVVGIFFGLPGLLLGPFVGAVLGELRARSTMRRAMDVGVATWIGLLLGAIAKIAIGIAIIGVFVFALVV